MNRLMLFVVMSVFSINTWAYSYTIELTQQQLQQQINAIMPVEKEAYFVKVILSGPRIDLAQGGNQLGVFTNIELVAPGGIRGTGRARIAGTISYRKDSGSFYLNNPKLTQMEIDQIPPQYHAKVRELGQFALDNAMSQRPLFTLDDNDMKQKMARSALESVTVNDGKLVIVLNITQP
ncbi:MAG: DUF1439 domain-containing protein [Gammaproteobacteria bacterium]|jgi:hypothetical protein